MLVIFTTFYIPLPVYVIINYHSRLSSVIKFSYFNSFKIAEHIFLQTKTRTSHRTKTIVVRDRKLTYDNNCSANSL